MTTNHTKLLLILLIGTWFADVHAQFVEMGEEIGVSNKYIASTYIGGGVGLIDVNNDMLLDVFLTGGINPDRLYLNTGNGFERKVLYLDPEDFHFLQYETIGLAVGDINNDGYDDILLNTAREYPCLLMVNNGDETFDIRGPEETGLNDEDWGVSATFGDVNNDGLLDIFATNYVDTISSWLDTSLVLHFDHVGFNNYLYINQDDEFFIEMGDNYGVQQKSTSLSSVFTDFDADRDVDLYVINDFGHFIIPNELYVNQYPVAQFEDRSEVSGADIGIFGMGCAVGDYDGDLDLDYYITNIGRNVLISNNGDGTFQDVTNLAGVQDSVDIDDGHLAGWGTGFFDYDNDGWQDLYISNGHIPAGTNIANPKYNINSLYKNNGDGSYSNVGVEMGIADPAACRGSAFGDLNNDGRLDLVFVPVNTIPNFVPDELNEKALFFYNETVNGHNWIKFKLDGVESNRNGYGSHIYVYDSDGHVQLKEADGGSSHASSNSPFIHFGLGSANAVDSMVVFWPSGKRTVIEDPDVNQLHIIEESDRGVISGYQEWDQREADAYPNPFTDVLKVRIDQKLYLESDSEFRIYSIDGSLVDAGFVNSEIFEIATETIPAGTYLLSIHVGEDQVFKTQLIKE